MTCFVHTGGLGQHYHCAIKKKQKNPIKKRKKRDIYFEIYQEGHTILRSQEISATRPWGMACG